MSEAPATTQRAVADAALVARRADFPPLGRFTWLQNGGVSLVPRPVHERHVALLAASFGRGPLHIAYPDEEWPRRDRSRARIGRFLGADADEVAIVRGVSEGFGHVLRGIEWRPGDEIVTSADEEGALLVPMLQLAREKGVRILRVALPRDGGEGAILDEAARLLGPATRLLAFSHVTTDLGVRLPAAALCALAEERGVPTFVDLAHAAGAVPLDVHALGCWYAGVVSYKWMMAPYAAGALYVRRDRLAALPVVYAGGRSDATLDRAAETMTLHAGARRFEFGPWSWPLVHAWAAALDYLEALGLEVVFDRCARLAGRLKEGLAGLPGVRVLTPLAPERSANLVAFDVKGWTGAALERHLRREHRIVVRSLMDEPDGVRASVAFFTLESEVDALIGAIGSLSRPHP